MREEEMSCEAFLEPTIDISYSLSNCQKAVLINIHIHWRKIAYYIHSIKANGTPN